ncbi:hypothetical protein EPYR_00384 [Erwinia pyrifoliae DSM 12163]|nr:hypothetical protein EPYR_00384 [Erwinia pyrifoliae DSM 12163]
MIAKPLHERYRLLFSQPQLMLPFKLFDAVFQL